MEHGRGSALGADSGGASGTAASVLLAGLTPEGAHREAAKPSRASMRKSGGSPTDFAATALSALQPRLSRLPAVLSGRYSVASSHRGSVAPRASILRGSGVRGPRGTALDSSGLPFERIAVIDEEGRDRTPKPLLAARPHGGSAEAAWGSSSSGAPVRETGTFHGGSGRTSVMSTGPGLPGISSAHSFLASEAGDRLAEGSLDGGMPSGGSGGRSGGRAAPAAHQAAAPRDAVQVAIAAVAEGSLWAVAESATPVSPPGGLLEAAGAQGDAQPAAHQAQPQAQRREQQRSKATQCPAGARASRGIQVLPWELRAAAAGAEEEAPADGGAPAAPQPEAAAGGGAAEEEEDEEALQALQQQACSPTAGSTGVPHRGSPIPTTRSGASQASSRRESVAGGWGRGGTGGLAGAAAGASACNDSRSELGLGRHT